MKKALLLILSCISLSAMAQTISFTLNQQPCNSNGVPNGTVTSSFPTVTPPVVVTYYFNNGSSIIHNATGTTDVLTGYSGAPMYVYANGANNTFSFGNYSAVPFSYSVNTQAGVCPGNGTATATVQGGQAPYQFEWYALPSLNVLSATNPASLPMGQYGIKITDANGCIFGSAYNPDSIFVETVASFQVTVGTTPANCTNGTASVNPPIGAGVLPYTYLWSNGATTSSINNLTKGNYQVTVTDAIGCAATGYGFVTQPITINTNVVTTPASCLQNDGAITAFGSGGMPPYSYLWTNGVPLQNQNNLPSGYYSLTITDANGCTGNGGGQITTTTPITVTTSATSSLCTAPTGTATLTISGGQTPYVISWNTFPAQSTNTISNMPAGTYSFNITDANGCVQNGAVVIPPQNIITASLSPVFPTCIASNGSLTVNPAGGALPYTYSWNNGTTTATNSAIPQGYYNVLITDNDGCSINKSTYLNATSPVTIGMATTQATCIFNADGSITANALGGTAPYTYSWSNGVNSATVSNLISGYYTVSVVDAMGCTAYASTFVPYNTSNNSCYATITGTVYEDANGNCTQDAGENGIHNIQIHCSNIGYAYSNANGVYSFIVPTGNYSVSQTVQTLYPLSLCQNNNVSVSAVASSGATYTVNFADTITPLHDLHISTWNFIPPVLGNAFTLQTIISNDGTVPENMMIAGLRVDTQLTPPLFTPSAVFVNNGLGWYDFGAGAVTLNPGTAQAINSTYQVPANIPLNTVLTFKDSVSATAPISNWLNDYTPWNNVNYITSSTLGSYDPNFKQVSPQGTGPQGNITVIDSVLDYNVHFQNLGNYYAEKVVVVDTLDADLDWTTLRPIYSSHPSTVTITEGGVLTYTFNNIHLPAKSMNDFASNGMFTYSIKTKKNLPIGTKFTNSAAIYFDFNAPVITNTTVNTLTQTQSISQVSHQKEGTMMLYPNPAGENVVAVVGKGNASQLSVVDVQGRMMLQQLVPASENARNIRIDAASLAPGIYFVRFGNDANAVTEKLVIMK